MKLLIVGGAGYIGSHMVKHLIQCGHDPIVFDNLSTGHRDAVRDAQLIEGDLADSRALKKLFNTHEFDAVMHFASFSQVAESVKKPDVYYLNNVACTINLLHAMMNANIKQFVFSSTAAIFGEPQRIPIDESHPKLPINAYGRSKLMVEHILQDLDQAFELKSVSLRYFNAAGADESGDIGERHLPETHLIPILLQTALGIREKAVVFGSDYPTQDGTCIRDYVHVSDLCEAHMAALNYLNKEQASNCFNLGNGEGFSVEEVIDAVKKVTGKNFDVVYENRRKGDPAILVADSKLARQVLDWRPRYTDLETIIQHAWQFEQKK